MCVLYTKDLVIQKVQVNPKFEGLTGFEVYAQAAHPLICVQTLGA